MHDLALGKYYTKSHAKLQAESSTFPITLWTDLDHKNPPFVEVTEGGMSIDWKLKNRSSAPAKVRCSVCSFSSKVVPGVLISLYKEMPCQILRRHLH